MTALDFHARYVCTLPSDRPKLIWSTAMLCARTGTPMAVPESDLDRVNGLLDILRDETGHLAINLGRAPEDDRYQLVRVIGPTVPPLAVVAPTVARQATAGTPRPAVGITSRPEPAHLPVASSGREHPLIGIAVIILFSALAWGLVGWVVR